MAGSIRQRSPGVWELRVYIGRDRSGRVRHRYASSRASALKRGLARLVTQQEDDRHAFRNGKNGPGDRPPPSTMPSKHGSRTVADLSPNTVRGYEGVWRRDVRDSIGRRRIATLSPYDVERYFRDSKEGGAGYTPSGWPGPSSTGRVDWPGSGVATCFPTRSPTPSCPRRGRPNDLRRSARRNRRKCWPS